MNDLVFLIANASIVCFVISYGLLKAFRSKALLLCLVFSPFVLIPALSGMFKQWILGYVFVLQYGNLGVIVGILLFEIDQVSRPKKLRYFTSWLARIVMVFPLFYIFSYITKSFFSQNNTVETSLEYASIFGLVSDSDLAVVEYIGSYFHIAGTIISVAMIMLCMCILVFNKYRQFKEVQRI